MYNFIETSPKSKGFCFSKLFSDSIMYNMYILKKVFNNLQLKIIMFVFSGEDCAEFEVKVFFQGKGF